MSQPPRNPGSTPDLALDDLGPHPDFAGIVDLDYDPRLAPPRGVIGSAEDTEEPELSAFTPPQPWHAPASAPPVAATPAPTPLPSLRRTPGIPRASDSGMVNFSPTGNDAVDLAAELVGSLTMRMKPPPEPELDLAPATAAWLGGTGLGVSIWVAAVTLQPGWLAFVYLLGGLMAAAGVGLAVHRAGRIDWRRGALALVPPVTLWRLCQPGQGGDHGPLRFVVSGVALAALAAAGPALADALRPSIAAIQKLDEAEEAGDAAPPKRSRLLGKSPDAQLDALVELARPRSRLLLSDEQRAEALSEVCELAAKSPRGEVRSQALRTLSAWPGAPARDLVLAALRSDDYSERRTGLELAARYPDAGIAQALAARLSNRNDESAARAALVQFPASAVDPAVTPLLRQDDWLLAMTAADILGQCGGEAGRQELLALSERSGVRVLRDQANRQACLIEARLKSGAK